MLGKLDPVGGKTFQGHWQVGHPLPHLLMPLESFPPSRVQFPQRCRPGLWGTPPCGAAHGPGCPNIYPLPAGHASPLLGSPGPWLAWPTSTVTCLFHRNIENSSQKPQPKLELTVVNDVSVSGSQYLMWGLSGGGVEEGGMLIEDWAL